jgi:hypothetical protein
MIGKRKKKEKCGVFGREKEQGKGARRGSSSSN